MLRHYLLTALRNAWRHRVTTAISIVGLAIGLTVFITAWGFLTLLKNGDHHFANADRIHLVVHKELGALGIPYTPHSLAAYLRTDFPALERVSQATSRTELAVSAGSRKALLRPALADAHFLRIFRLPFLRGDSAAALDRPRSVILSRDAALKLFGSIDVVGKHVQMRGIDLAVTGVIDPIPGPTHMGPNGMSGLIFDILVSLDVQNLLEPDLDAATEGWSDSAYVTYALFPRDGRVTPATLNRDLPAFVRRHVPADIRASFTAKPIWTIQPAADDGRVGIVQNVLILTLGSLILAVACVNYANLAGALALGRTREIGLRKVLGAARGQLMRQYLFEAALHALVALIIALLLVALLIPVFGRLRGFPVGMFLVQTPPFWIGIAAILCVSSLLAGIYPALVAWRAMPAVALRAGGRRSGRGTGLKLLVALQFAVASFLLIVALLMHMQKQSLLALAPRPAADPVVVVSKMNVAEVNPDAFHAQLRQSPHILAVSATSDSIWSGGSRSIRLRRTPAVSESPFSVTARFIYYDFFETMGIRLLAGRDFSRSRGDDAQGQGASAQRPFNIVVDAAFAAQMRWSPGEAVGKALFRRNNHANRPPPTPVTIVGVVDNMALGASGDAGLTAGTVYLLDPAPTADPPGMAPVGLAAASPGLGASALIRVSKSRLPAALADIDAAWNRLVPGMPITRSLLSESFDRYYENLNRITLAIAAFVACGFFLAVSGLAGMAIHIVSRRTHEIGVRKTLGSSTSGIVRLLLLGFARPILVGCLLGWPLAYLLGRVILGGFFADPVAITPMPFLLSLVIAMAIGGAAVAVPTWRAARANPAEVLHHE